MPPRSKNVGGNNLKNTVPDIGDRSISTFSIDFARHEQAGGGTLNCYYLQNSTMISCRSQQLCYDRFETKDGRKKQLSKPCTSCQWYHLSTLIGWFCNVWQRWCWYCLCLHWNHWCDMLQISWTPLPWVLLTKVTGEEDFAFENRNVEQGIYSYLLNELMTDEGDSSMHAGNLSFAEIGKHYHCFAQEYGPHKTYRVCKTEDHVFKGFGQVMPISEGTMLGAMGNHYSGPFSQVSHRFWSLLFKSVGRREIRSQTLPVSDLPLLLDRQATHLLHWLTITIAKLSTSTLLLKEKKLLTQYVWSCAKYMADRSSACWN